METGKDKEVEDEYWDQVRKPQQILGPSLLFVDG